MPIVWSPENEARLLAGLFKVCEIKVSGAQLKELAAIIGPDCTAKAVTHRIAKFKKMASAFNGGKKGGEAAAEDADSEDGAEGESTPKTPKSTKKGAKGGKGGKKRPAAEDDDDDDDDDEQLAKKLKAEDSDNFQ